MELAMIALSAFIRYFSGSEFLQSSTSIIFNGLFIVLLLEYIMRKLESALDAINCMRIKDTDGGRYKFKFV